MAQIDEAELEAYAEHVEAARSHLRKALDISGKYGVYVEEAAVLSTAQKDLQDVSAAVREQDGEIVHAAEFADYQDDDPEQWSPVPER